MSKRVVLGIVLILCLFDLSVLASGFEHSVAQIGKGLSSSEAPPLEWNMTYGGAGEEKAYSMIQTSDSGYALVGSTASLGISTVLFVKTDAAGNMQWNRTYGRQQQPNGDLAQSVIQTSDGGYAFAGASWNQARGAHDLFMVKTDSGGNMDWNLTYIRDTSGGSLDWGHAFSVTQTNDGGYMVGASVRHHPDHSTGDWDGWLIKTDANGTVQWDKPYGGSSDEGIHGVLQTGDGGYIFVGTTLSYGSGSGDVWLVKTDDSGIQQWAKTFGGSNWDDGNSIAKTSDGGYIIGAATSSFGAGSWDFWIIKTDANGNQQWTDTFGGVNEDRALSVIETFDGCFALAGSTKSFGAGDSDFWMVETDSLGNQEWNRTFGGANYDDARSIVQTADKGYAVAGYTDSFGAGSYDLSLVKLAGSGPKTWTVDDDGPADFHTIQDAINAASDGDTIFVRNGTYYEHLIINKSLALVGEDRDLTVVDGSGNGEIADIQANNVYIGNFTLQNAGMGGYGAVWVQGYSNAVIRNNTMIDNRHGVCVWTGALNATVSGNLIYNRQPSYADGIRLGLSSGHLVTGNVVLNESTGIGLDWTFNNTVEKNILLNNYIGIGAGNPSYDNVFSENTVANNSYGFLIAIYNSRFFHNSILNNSVQAAFYGAYSNVWDNGYPSGGNYWSDYVGVDLYRGPYQNETGSDGIGDTPYVIGLTNQDNYPFLTPNGWLVNATNLSFSLVPNPAYVGQTVTMVGRLSDRFNSPINNAEIDVYVNGTLSGTLVTNSSGWFAASAKVNVAGTYNVTAVCNVQNYNPSSHTESLIVRPKLNTKVSFTFSPNPVGAGQWVLMAGNLTDAYGSLIGDAPLEVYVKSGAGPWKYVGNISTDSSGKIWVFGRVMSKGTYQVAVLYRGSYKHNLSYHIETLTVNP